MGIEGLGSLLRKKSPALFRSVTYADLRGCSIAFDMHLFVYQVFYRNNGDNDAVCRDLEQVMGGMARYGIRPRFVFDGNTRGLKPRAHKLRKEASEKVDDEVASLEVQLSTLEADIKTSCDALCEGAITPPSPRYFSTMTTTAAIDTLPPLAELVSQKKEVIEKLEKSRSRAIRPTSETFRAARSIIGKCFGEECIVTAEDDGERAVANMCKDAVVEYAASSDYDTLAFGSPNLLINFLQPAKMALIRLSEVLTCLELESLEQFQDFCILCGCDFCGKVPGVGPINALKLIKTHKSIESMFDCLILPKLEKGGCVDSFDFAFARKRFRGET